MSGIIDRIEQALINSDLTPRDLKIALEILEEAEKDEQRREEAVG